VLNPSAKWREKHPCINCDMGYGLCIYYGPVELRCCSICHHPGRWVTGAYTPDDIDEMVVEWSGRKVLRGC
jgi:hypothetical protein